jgi:serine/threonine protein phosphatase PrpC
VVTPTAPGRFELHTASVGDTRAYLLDSGPARPVTTDHTRGDALTGWLAFGNRPPPDLNTVQVGSGDVVAVLTDQAWKNTSNITDILKGRTTPADIAELLVDAALTTGGSGDRTAAVIRIP